MSENQQRMTHEPEKQKIKVDIPEKLNNAIKNLNNSYAIEEEKKNKQRIITLDEDKVISSKEMAVYSKMMENSFCLGTLNAHPISRTSNRRRYNKSNSKSDKNGKSVRDRLKGSMAINLARNK